MLTHLQIRDLAIVDALELDFTGGLTVLTGETGAGKSIVVEAVGLLMGGRASSDLVRTGADSALIQAEIESPDGETLAVRREITAQGRAMLRLRHGARRQRLGLQDGVFECAA